MKLTIADLVVLSVFVQGGPMHGYEAWRRLAESDVQDWAQVSRPQVYYSLRKLAETAHLERLECGEPSKGPERATFRATAAASTALRGALRQPHWTRRAAPDPFVTWGALALNADDETIRSQIKQRRATLEAEIGREEASLVVLDGCSGRDIAVARALIRMAIARMKAELGTLGDLSCALGAP